MQTANLLRGLITKAKGDVAKWTAIEDVHRREMRHGQADGAKKCLGKAIKRLEELRQKFEDLSFPNSNITVARTEHIQCEGCGASIAKGNTYCGECLCED